MHEASKALLCAGHPPARVRQISGFAKISACAFYKGRLKNVFMCSDGLVGFWVWCKRHAYDYAALIVPTQVLRSFAVSTGRIRESGLRGCAAPKF